MDEKTIYWASVGLGAVALLLLIINMSTINNNRQLQDEISQRAGIINNSVTLDQLDKGLANMLADVAIKDSDNDARSLLAAQGINIPAPTAKAEEPAKEAKKKVEKSDE